MKAYVFLGLALAVMFFLSNPEFLQRWFPDRYNPLKTGAEDQSIQDLFKPLYELVPKSSHTDLDRAKKHLGRFKEQALAEGTEYTKLMATKAKVIESLNQTTFFLPNDMDRELKIRGYIAYIDKMLQGYMYHLYGTPFDDFGYSSIQDVWK